MVGASGCLSKWSNKQITKRGNNEATGTVAALCEMGHCLAGDTADDS